VLIERQCDKVDEGSDARRQLMALRKYRVDIGIWCELKR
jgi:hypothetical protein